MKKTIILLLFIFLAFVKVTAQSPGPKLDPVGKWEFEAPYAPEGYTDGTVEIALAEAKYSLSMLFSGSDYKFSGEQVKFEEGTLKFLIWVEGNGVDITLKFESESKMNGKAAYSEGEIPLTLVRVPEKK